MSQHQINKKLKKARALVESKKFQQALNLYGEILKIDPTQPDALHFLGVAANANNNKAQAINYIQASLSVNPEQDMAHYDLAMIYENLGDVGKAAEHCLQACIINPDKKYYLNSFVKLVRPMRFGVLNQPLLTAITNVMAQPSVEGNLLVPVWFSLYRYTDTWGALQSLCDNKSPGHNELAAALEDQVLVTVLCNTVVGMAELENVLTKIRKNISTQWNLAEVPTIFLAALSYQGFGNEYVWNLDADEMQVISKLEAKAQEGQITLSELLLLAAYQPLHRVTNIQACKDVCVNSEIMIASDIWRQQVEEPSEEWRIKDKIPHLTEIDDEISKSVQGQYEVNPYPRWENFSGIEPISFKRFIAKAYPYLDKKVLASVPEHDYKVLVAGCGSGKQPNYLAATFEGHKDITAVDLSLTSLAYAIRKQNELQPDAKINFGQADILKLGEVCKPESFDIIECTGVLHHMDDPMAGWQVLCGLLKKNGFMKIGLYSELAREQVNIMRAKVAKEGIPTTDDGIRKLRKYVKDNAEEKNFNWLIKTVDFYSMSGCRDLLFHVQEHQYNFLKIKEALSELGLTLIGFESHAKNFMEVFASSFPNEPLPGALECWHEFEKANPQLFAAMYQFWVQKQ